MDLISRVLAIALLLLMFSAAAAQENQTPDTLFFDPVKIWYPGQPGNGAMRADLQWLTTDSSGALMLMLLDIDWTGQIHCDSFAADYANSEVMTITATIDNENDRVSIRRAIHEGVQLDRPAVYELGKLFFTIQDTGVVQLTSQYGPGFTMPPAMYWWGHWVPDAYYISNPGDVNNDGTAGNITDAVATIGYIFGTYPDYPVPFADVNGDCLTNVTDVVSLIDYIFGAKRSPAPGCEF
ncbi:MAG: dockerin type I repeat-containing protein [bacterium]